MDNNLPTTITSFRPSKEFGGVLIHFEHKTRADISPDDLTALKKFLKVEQNQTNLYKQRPTADLAIYIQRLYALGNHSTGITVLQTEMKTSKTPLSRLQLILAETASQEIIGFSFVCIKDQEANPADKVTFTYLGIGWDYTHKGIAAELLRERFDDLRTIGIHTYKTRVWKDSRDLYTKLGIQIEQFDPKDKQNVRVTFA
jgi:hypothetical protein